MVNNYKHILYTSSIQRITLFSFVLFFLSLAVFGQKKTFHSRKTNQILTFIQQNHYDPVPVDSQFCALVNSNFITSLDPLGIFFTAEEVNALESTCPDLSVMDINSNKNFMDHVSSIYKYCLYESEEWMNRVLLNPIDFQVEDTLVAPKQGKTIYPKNTADLEENWEKYLRFQLLRYYFSTFHSDDTSFVKNESNFLLHQDTIRNAIFQREYCKINHLINYPGGFEEYLFSVYLNTLTTSFDPHTNYFTISDKALFESSISRNKISFGVDLDQNNNGEIVISRLIPGGPAWRSGDLNPGDILLSLHFPGSEPVDLTCSDLSEIQELVYNSSSDHIEITVRSQLGQVKTINLRMEVLSAAENSVYSFILEGDRKIGFISLPGFYTEPDKKDPLGCASDLAKEILKLESDSIEGLILDVRNNGGGSIIEAVDLAGIFIDSGPLCIYKTHDEKPALIKDLHRGSQYDGPMILMVNGYSASASEILAGILQDYNRAVVVGTPTFGKASGQVIIPLGEPGNGSENTYSLYEEPTDYIKITTSRYYRLNGKSHQAVGITPDINLPAHAGFSRVKESAYPSALKYDSIIKDIRFDPFPELPMIQLQQASEKRVSINQNFQDLLALNDSITSLYSNDIKIPLSFSSFRKDYNRNKGFFNEIDSLKAYPGASYSITDNSRNNILLENNEYKMEIHKEIIENLSNDFYLEEAYHVLDNLISLDSAGHIGENYMNSENQFE